MRIKQLVDRMTMVMLVAFLVAPVLTPVLLGPPKPYGQKPFEPLRPPLSRLVKGILERSWVRRSAIKVHNQFHYGFLGYMDTPRIVSGRSDWLFNKQQFWQGQCMRDDWFAVALNRVDMIQALAERAGVRVRFSVSPDKYSIYPEYVHPRSLSYVGCRAQNGARWRALARELAPDLVDHTRELLTEKAARSRDGDERLLYYSTDTHWNTTVAPVVVDAIALMLGAQLRELSTITTVQGGKNIRTDLRNGLLLLDERESVTVRSTVIRQVSRPKSNATIVHDSFYNKLRRQLAKALPGAKFYHISHDRKIYEPLVKSTSAPLIINSVERAFFGRFQDPRRSPISQTILRRNMASAQNCRFVDGGRSAEITSVNNATVRGSSYTATNGDPQIVVRRNVAALGCLKVKLKLAKAGLFEVFLPNRTGRKRRAAFEAGRSFALELAAGTHDLKFILPRGLQLPLIRVDPTNVKSEFEILDLRFGLLKE